MTPIIVAIDGPSGVGKSTTSKAIARELKIPHIDTGAMYRAIALKALQLGVDLDDEQRLASVASSSRIGFDPSTEIPRVLLDGEDVSSLIRQPEISMAASTVSAVPSVRRVLVALQQTLGREGGGVLEGRDIGTKVFPETPHKFFLTARPEVRAGRRYRELIEKGTPQTLAQVREEMEKRDLQDSTRTDSPLTFDGSYTVVDTSDRSVTEVVRTIVDEIRRRLAEHS